MQNELSTCFLLGENGSVKIVGYAFRFDVLIVKPYGEKIVHSRVKAPNWHGNSTWAAEQY